MTDRQRCSDLWFDDGNIVLQAEQTLFRVFKSVLGRESSVFADMLSLPGRSAELYEGIPLVHMPDSAEDMTLFLSVIFNFDFLQSLDASPKLATILVTATKYQGARVRRRIIAMLSREFPSTLQEYDGLRSKASQGACKGESDFWTLTLATIKAARCSDAHSLLPAAFLCAASRGMPDILAQDALEAMDRNTILIGRDKLSREARQESFYGAFCGHFCDKVTCSEERDRVRGSVEIAENFFDPFHVVSPPVDQSKACWMVINMYTVGYGKVVTRGVVWDTLPTIFGLPAWADLVKEEDELWMPFHSHLQSLAD